MEVETKLFSGSTTTNSVLFTRHVTAKVTFLNGHTDTEQWTLVFNRHGRIIEVIRSPGQLIYDQDYSVVYGTRVRLARRISHGKKELLEFGYIQSEQYIATGEIRSNTDVGYYDDWSLEQFVKINHDE